MTITSAKACARLMSKDTPGALVCVLFFAMFAHSFVVDVRY
jgi:hypothetical protein